MRCLLRFAVSYQGYTVTMAIQIQPCVEVTFLAIFSEFQQSVQPIVMDMLKKVQGAYLDVWCSHCITSGYVYRERYLS